MIGSVRRYATATFNDEQEENPPIRWAFLFLYDDEAAARADAEALKMEGPYQWIDEMSWLIAWEGEPEQRGEIRERLLGLGAGLTWSTSVMPEVPVPQVDGISIKSNCYDSMQDALDAFGL